MDAQFARMLPILLDTVDQQPHVALHPRGSCRLSDFVRLRSGSTRHTCDLRKFVSYCSPSLIFREVEMLRLSAYLRRIAIGGALLLVTGTVMVAGASPADAHLACTFHSDGSYVCLSADHIYLAVCDEDVDGNYAYARTYRYGVAQQPLYDRDGAAGGCTYYYAYAGSLDSFNVCVQNEGCGRPIYWWEF